MKVLMKKRRNVLIKGHSPFLSPYGGRVHWVGKGHGDSDDDAGVTIIVIIVILMCDYPERL